MKLRFPLLIATFLLGAATVSMSFVEKYLGASVITQVCILISAIVTMAGIIVTDDKTRFWKIVTASWAVLLTFMLINGVSFFSNLH